MAKKKKKKKKSGGAKADGTRLLQAAGFVTFLRVNDLGAGFGGGASNPIPVEVVFRLDSKPDNAFGFQLRDDEWLPARQGMLAILRDAMIHGLEVTTDYEQRVSPPDQNGIAIRVWITRSPADPRRPVSL
ncbi:MAG: hypothetical protein ACXWXS_07860 [Actinomycetota bacterium]